MTLSTRIDRLESNSKLSAAYVAQQGVASLVDVSTIEASTGNGLPVASVVKKLDGTSRNIYNLANDLGVRMGVERIMTQQPFEIQDEVGTGSNSGAYNGTVDQKVWGVVGDKYNQIRFVGSGWRPITSWVGSGSAVENGAVLGDYIEIIFYGTGLNIFAHSNASNPRDLRVSVDGGAEGSNILVAMNDNVLFSRNYSPNIIWSVCSGLTLGWHIVRIRLNAAFTQPIYGFEILNESSLLNVRPGTAYGNNVVNTLAVASTPAYNSTFDTGSLGTKGGCVVAYLKSDGTVGKSVTPTDSGTPLYTTNATHANEELIRTYYVREFGAGRSDDFSTLYATSGTARAFTCDDGTTTLVLTSGNLTNGEQLQPANTNDFMTFTFVGTGLDLIHGSLNGSSYPYNVIIDGTTQATGFYANANATVKICSGLSYGTHTVKLLATSANTFSVKAFKVYAPKKPSIPTGAIELSQYYVMADYSANSTAGLDTIATGVLRKQTGTREAVLVGANWSFNSMDVASFIGGWSNASNTATQYLEYNFMGTGFEHRFYGLNVARNWTYAVYDSAGSLVDLSTKTTSTYPAGFTFTASTGVLTGNPASTTVGCGVRVSGLTYGKYKLRVTLNSGSSVWNEVLDIITPIHYPKVQTEGVTQNTLPVGSCGLGDLRNIPRTTKPSKIVAIAKGVASGPNTTSTSMIPMPDMSVTVNSNGNWFSLNFIGQLYNNTTGGCNYVQFYVDGTPIGSPTAIQSTANYNQTHTNVGSAYLSRGTHKVDVYWSVSNVAHVGYLNGAVRQFIVSEN